MWEIESSLRFATSNNVLWEKALKTKSKKFLRVKKCISNSMKNKLHLVICNREAGASFLGLRGEKHCKCGRIHWSYAMTRYLVYSSRLKIFWNPSEEGFAMKVIPLSQPIRRLTGFLGRGDGGIMGLSRNLSIQINSIAKSLFSVSNFLYLRHLSNSSNTAKLHQ